jgi:hypothetical protein
LSELGWSQLPEIPQPEVDNYQRLVRAVDGWNVVDRPIEECREIKKAEIAREAQAQVDAVLPPEYIDSKQQLALRVLAAIVAGTATQDDIDSQTHLMEIDAEIAGIRGQEAVRLLAVDAALTIQDIKDV